MTYVFRVLSHVRLFVNPWTVARQARMPMGFSKQEYGSGLPFSSPGNLPYLDIELACPVSPALLKKFQMNNTNSKSRHCNSYLLSQKLSMLTYFIEGLTEMLATFKSHSIPCGQDILW